MKYFILIVLLTVLLASYYVNVRIDKEVITTLAFILASVPVLLLILYYNEIPLWLSKLWRTDIVPFALVLVTSAADIFIYVVNPIITVIPHVIVSIGIILYHFKYR